MPEGDIFLQNWIFTKFFLPLLLIFVIVFAILEKTKIFGEDKKQLNAILALVIGLIFVSVAYPKEVVGNLILFLTVALVVLFVVLILWGFVSGGDLKGDFLTNKGVKWTVGIGVVIATVFAVVWAMGIQGGVLDLLFYQTWSGTFWTNVLFIAGIGLALALVLRKNN